MKSARLFEILYILINNKKTTAKELAERFEVSTRTIYRDIDALSSSNIPIYTTKGKGGGVFLLENFKLKSTLLNSKEQNQVLNAVSAYMLVDENDNTQLLDKLNAVFEQKQKEWISIDYSPWGGGDDFNKKFDKIKRGILESCLLQIEYVDSRTRKSKRCIMPLKIINKNAQWYVYAYCKKADNFRFFKMARIISIDILDEQFEELEYNLDLSSFDYKTDNDKRAEFLIDKKYEYNVVGDFGIECVEKYDGHRCLVSVVYSNDNDILNYLLMYGQDVEIISPDALRDKMKKKIEQMSKVYQN